MNLKLAKLRETDKALISCVFSSDDLFLLQFLRAKKYSIEKVFTVFENHLKFRKNHPEWFDLSDEKVETMKKLCRTGFLFPLLERDAEGRRILLFNVSQIDPKAFKSTDVFHLMLTVIIILLHEGETQIAGLNLLIRFDDLTFNQARMFSLFDTIYFAKFLTSSCPGRVKGFYFENTPSIMTYLISAGKAVLSKKLRNRMFMLKCQSRTFEIFDASLFPKEIGGSKFTEHEMIENFLDIFDSKLNLLKKTNEF